MLVSMGNHADNVYTMLSARATAPHIPVIARANADETVDRLALAGAYVDRTIGEVGLRQHGVKVMAIGRDGEQQFGAGARREDFALHDVLVMIGPPPNVRRFAEQAGV